PARPRSPPWLSGWNGRRSGRSARARRASCRARRRRWHPDFAPKPGDLIAAEHWGQSGFANTNLDFLLKQKGITHVIVVGLLANTCIESTARFAMELGYHVTLVRDATAAFSHDMMHAAHELNGPTYAHSILTTTEAIAALPAASDSKETVK
ncbi:cysteine hydrolase, partial [Bradyrhizobium uaiense]|uniref:cysteine hydrolase n=1 Tax=Bradyrhizobium uaiense TaxID=2594946 RepID=UPI001F39FC31